MIRIDGLPGIDPNSTLESVKKKFGPMDLWDEPNDEYTLPSGSEGSLQYEVIEYSTGLPWIAVAIWGDLRDVDSSDEIEKWWTDVQSKFQFIRDAVLSIEIEGGPRTVLGKNK